MARFGLFESRYPDAFVSFVDLAVNFGKQRGTMGRQGGRRLSASLRAHERQLLTVPNRVLYGVIAGCVLLVIAIPTLLYEANSGVTLMTNQETSSVVSTWAKFDAQQECIRRAITRSVPKDATIIVSRDQDEFLQGQLLELSTPWARPVSRRDQATYSLAIVGGTRCGGESLKVTPIA